MWYQLFLILGILAVFGEFSMLFSWIFVRTRFKRENIPNYNPIVYIIIPCKGVEKNFIQNVKAISTQEYNNHKIIFVTDSKEDLAYKKLNQLFSTDKKIKIVVSDFIQGCSGKISALISGLKYAKDAEVYVFADSDIHPHKKWLLNLVSHLKNDNVGVTTGYRWYFPYNLKSLFISCWNMTNSLSLFINSLNFAWGGSTAIKKSLFDKLNIQKEWEKGFSDDLILTNIVKKAGYKIKFIPKCISESPSDENILNFIKWGTRQLTWIRWYYPSKWVWMFSVFGIISLKIATITGFILIIVGYTIPGLIMVSTMFFEIISGFIAHSTFQRTMYYPKDKFGSSLSYALMLPIVFFVIAYNNLASLFKTEIKWGGRTYKNPNK